MKKKTKKTQPIDTHALSTTLSLIEPPSVAAPSPSWNIVDVCIGFENLVGRLREDYHAKTGRKSPHTKKAVPQPDDVARKNSYSVQEVAALRGQSVSTIRRHIAEGSLKATGLRGRARRVSHAELVRYHGSDPCPLSALSLPSPQ